MKYIPATGNPNAKLMILGDAPSYQDVEAGKLLIGSRGRELDRLLSDCKINRNDLWISTVSKYYINPNTGTKKIPFHVRAQQSGVNLDEQVSDLQNEINSIKPNCILALGSPALWALKGSYKINSFRGSILFGMGCKFVPTYSPDLSFNAVAEFKGYWNRQVIALDIKRAWNQAAFPEVVLPSRNLQICRSSAQLADFITRYKNHKNPSIDIEARGGQCIPNCIGIAFTPHEGLTIPLWNKGEIEDIALIPDSEMVSMWILLAELLAKSDVIGQNFKYDQDKISRLGFTVKGLYSDTLLKAFTINPELPKSLAFNTSIYTEEPYYKDEGMYEGKLEDLYKGNALDACVTKEIDLAMDADIDELGLRNFYQNFVMKLHSLYLDIENQGMYVNDETKKTLLEKYVRWSESLSYELFNLTDAYVNVNSPKQVATLLFDVLHMPKRAGTGEEEITALLNNQGKTGVKDEKNRRILEIILEKRRVDKTVGNYLMALPDYDGKMKTTYYLCLETGRTSTGQLEPPIRPIVELVDGKGKKKTKAIGTAFQTMTKHGDIGQDIRSMYEPEKGYVFIQADSAQAEARVVFLLANDEQALKDIDTHDYHALTASWFFGKDENAYSKKVLGYEHPIRFVGKMLRHSGHLGAGKRLTSISVNTNARRFKVPISITEAIAERALKIFHQKQPKIQQVFHKGIIESLEKGKRFLTAAVPYGIDSPIGGKRQFFERWGDELFRMAFSYIPQRAISDNTKACALRLKTLMPNLRIILEAHDSLLFMIRESDTESIIPIIKEEMERPIRFDTCSLSRRDLIIPCEVEIGYNYQELKKHKLAVPIEQSKIEEREQLYIPPVQKTVTEEFRL